MSVGVQRKDCDRVRKEIREERERERWIERKRERDTHRHTERMINTPPDAKTGNRV